MGLKPKFTDGHRFKRPYVQTVDQGANYLQLRFRQIRKEQAEQAERKAAAKPIQLIRRKESNG